MGRGQAALARWRVTAYLDGETCGLLASRIVRMVAMAQSLSTPQGVPVGAKPARKVARVVAVVAASLAAILLLAALLLWFHYGTAVFFEMIAAGFAACF